MTKAELIEEKVALRDEILGLKCTIQNLRKELTVNDIQRTKMQLALKQIAIIGSSCISSTSKLSQIAQEALND
jgi:hypothetical protein